MLKFGIIDPEARFELLDGEIFNMPEEGELHVWIKNMVSHAIYDRVSKRYSIMTDSTLRLSEDSAPDPDVYVVADAEPLAPIKPEQVRLAIEVADSSIGLDLGRKAALYAKHGIDEYWVIDLQGARTHVLRMPEDQSYRLVAVVGFSDPLEATSIPGLVMLISSLPGMRDFGA